MAIYCYLADALVVFHAACVAFAVFGLLLILVGMVRRWSWVRNFWFRAAHLAYITIVVLESLCGIVCPLTHWETQLRVLGGEEGEPGSFIGRAIHRVLFFHPPEGVLTALYCLFGAAVLATFVFAPPRRPGFMTRKKAS